MTVAPVKETRSLNRIGRVATLNNGAIAAATDSSIGSMGNCEVLTLFLNASAATTVSIYTSPDNVNWYLSPTAWSPAGPATDVISIPASPFVKVQSSAGITLVAQAYSVGGW